MEMYYIEATKFKDMVNHATKEVAVLLRIHKTAEVYNKKGKLNDIGGKLILKIKQIKQTREMLEEKTSIEKVKFQLAKWDVYQDFLSEWSGLRKCIIAKKWGQ